MDIAGWRRKIDRIDRKLVTLLDERARAVRAIGRLKRAVQSPIREPERERGVLDKVRALNPGTLSDDDLVKVFRRIIGVMRKVQTDEARRGK